MQSLIEHLKEEVRRADEKYGSPASAHESYGVLAEEVAELLEAIRANAREAVRHEALQVAAVALRLAWHCRNGDWTMFYSRSGFNTPLDKRQV